MADLEPSQALWRSDLYRALHDHAVAHGIGTEYGKRLVAVDEAPTGITARFADGSAATADVLIGADGIHSTVRTLIDLEAPGPKTLPLLNFGAAADLAVPAAPDAMYFVFGSRAFLGYWVQPDGRTSWFSNLPYPEPMTIAQARAVPADEWLRRLREIYSGDDPAREILRTPAPSNSPASDRWRSCRRCRTGIGAGWCWWATLRTRRPPVRGRVRRWPSESAVQLARCLRDLPDVASAFAAYEGLRRPRVEKVARRAAKTNNSKALGPAAITMMRLMMPIATRTFLTPERTLGPEQRYRIDWAAQVTPGAASRSTVR